MRITTLVARAILASSTVAAPFQPPTIKNQSGKLQKQNHEYLVLNETSATPESFKESSPRFLRENTAKHLPFASHADILERLLTLTSYASSGNGWKNKTNASLSTHHHSRSTFHRIQKGEIAAVAIVDGDSVYEELVGFFEAQSKNQTKLSKPQIGQALKSLESLDATKFSDEAKAQRIIDQLQANLNEYHSHKFNPPKKQIDAITDAEDQVRHLNVSRIPLTKRGEKLREAGENQIIPFYLIYPGLFPSANNRYPWDENIPTSKKTSHIWSDSSKLSEKRDFSQNPDNLPESQFTQSTYPAADSALSDDAKLEKGREYLNNIRTYLEDEEKFYSTDDSLPAVFEKAWKAITEYGLPMKFKKAYMDMVKEYLMSASHQPRYTQDGSDHVPVDLNPHDKLKYRLEEPALFKFLVPEHNNALLHRGEDGPWLDDDMTWHPDEDPENDETVRSDEYAKGERSLSTENKSSPLYHSRRNDIDTRFDKQTAESSSILSIDGEEAYKTFHANEIKNTKVSKRQTTPDEAFSHEESAEAFQRYVMELEQEQDSRNGYQPHEMSAAEQDDIRTQLRETAENSEGTAAMKTTQTKN